ncbi:MAG: cyclic nucleotide-binding/CBS domain-containing protein [Candidatus Hodarchaeota archaeon]
MTSEAMKTTAVADLMRPVIHSVDHLSSVLSCAKAINHNEAPAVLITSIEDLSQSSENPRIESGESVIGIVTPGDILRKNVEKCLDPCIEVAESIMASPVIQIGPENSIREALGLMLTRNIQKLVVTSQDNVVLGMITMSDIAVAFLGSAPAGNE